MINKSLSQQICEICGIEEQKILVVGFDEYDITLPIFKTVNQTSDELCVRVVREHCLPDFKNNNNNFVKLLSLNTDYIQKGDKQIPCKPIWWIVNADALKFSSFAPFCIQYFLISLLVILENKYNTYPTERINEIKQAIKQADWEL